MKAAAKKAAEGQVVIRSAERADIEKFSNKMMASPSIKGWVASIDDQALMLGGLALINGRWIGFIDATPEAREYLKKNMMVRVQFMRMIAERLKEFKEQGIRYIYAEADTDQPRAIELLEKFGFKIDPRSQYLYRWTP